MDAIQQVKADAVGSWPAGMPRRSTSGDLSADLALLYAAVLLAVCIVGIAMTLGLLRTNPMQVLRGFQS